MAMPSGYDANIIQDDESERTNDVNEYRRTCIDFIKDISHDYMAWVDYYKLPQEEDSRRRAGINATVERTCEWIGKVSQTITAVDVVMNDGIQKMAESTAGKPLQIGVFVNKRSGYTEAKPGIIDVTIKGAARPEKKIKLGHHFKDSRFRIESTCDAYMEETGLPHEAHEMLDAHLVLHAEKAASRDLVSFTVTFVEVDHNDNEGEKRGLTTIVHIV